MADVTSETERRNEPTATAGKTIVVMPALNAAKTLELTVSSIPRDVVDEVLLVDDRSTDETLEIARGLDVSVIWHPHNVGYGGNQKTCYLEALQRDANTVVMLHPDGQYEPALIPKLIEPIQAGAADMVLGSRMLIPGAAREAGMPLYKRAANRFLTTVENRVLGTHLTDLHTGYRAYSRELLLTVPFLRNSLDFSFDSELLMQAAQFRFRIAEVPARTRYFEEASSVGFGASSVYGMKTLWAATRLLLHRSHLVPSRKYSA
ncbi:MAG TPA: glycosyltransferase family 2 protein [Solirubrobacterales bacterium]